MSRDSALALADERELDLVLISPNAEPPVARVMDYGKYRYDKQKREKEAKKKQKVIEIKEIRLSTFIDAHDLETKAAAAIRFLGDGDKIKVNLRFKGRERGRTERGYEVVNRFLEMLSAHGTPEKEPIMEGRSLAVTLAPVANKKAKAAVAPAPAPKPEETSEEE